MSLKDDCRFEMVTENPGQVVNILSQVNQAGKVYIQSVQV